ncbi:MAG: endolytic transglycosylase MltG [Gammaproteobacteria bacterium]|nr:endolytic transglycosylase MltG [Gammaproteobacteria bacterium]
MKRILVPALLLIVATTAFGNWVWTDMQEHLNSPLAVARTETFVVESGMSMRQVAAELRQRGWLEAPVYLEWEARSSGRAGMIKAGEYAITPGTTPRSLLDLLVSGQVIQHELTLIEGWSFREMLRAVAADPVLHRTLSGASPAQVMEEIGFATVDPEGRFLPDTYRFPAGTTDREFLRRAALAMQQVLADAWPARAPVLPYANPYEALIMASLVEKESADPAERSRIAGVFVRRLKLGMRLQTDPAVIYALGENFDGNLRREDLEIESPFNTYRVTGLPPTPIAMPGRASIHAALHPDEESALYFVARGNGTHEFSATLEEHNRAVQKYQLGSGN